MKILAPVLPALLLLLTPRPAEARFAGHLGKTNAERARLACALVQRFGPNRALTKLKIAIQSSPFGPLTVRMWRKVELRVDVSNTRHKAPPSQAERTQIISWLRKQLPAKPRACKLLLGWPGMLQRLQYPGKPLSHLSGAEYVEVQLRLYELARARSEPDAWRWADGAVSAYQGLSKADRRKLRNKRAAVRVAAYLVVRRGPPPGLSRLGRESYCQWYRKLPKLLPPRTAAQRRALKRARKQTGCR